MENILNKNTIEFLTVANEYCAFLEKSEKYTQQDFINKMQKILPLLYLKATMLPPPDDDSATEAEYFVSEYDYEYIKNKTSQKLGLIDAYISIFPTQENYAEYEQAEISECATDIYQDLKNFSENYRTGADEAMNASLTQCINNFKEYWGMRLISLQAALHCAVYFYNNDDETEQNLQNETQHNGNNLINNFLENYHKTI